MAIEWTEELATGVTIIDDQHKELFRRINALLEACSRGKGKEEIARVIQFLEDYVISHFSEEEERMQQSSYPAYAEHKAQHEEFKRNFAEVKQLFETNGPAVFVVIKTNHVVIDWLKAHIKRIDRAFGAFLQAAGPAGAQKA
ncbi:MAG: bacteriohemerythrin [Nitrospirae bacterium]|nr:MAG: bacteriohemerythrin [Nitrospirota bacterium]